MKKAKLLFDIEGKLPKGIKDTGEVPPKMNEWHYGHIYEVPDDHDSAWFEYIQNKPKKKGAIDE